MRTHSRRVPSNSRRWRTWLAWLVGLGITMGCPTHCDRGGEGTGGAGEAGDPPLGQDSTTREGETLSLEVLGVSVGDPEVETDRTSFLTREPITVRGRVRDDRDLEERIQWTIQPVGKHTADADPTSHEGQQAVFRAFSRVGTGGSRKPNPPLEYELVATLPIEGGEPLRVRLPPTTLLRQDEADVLRQEYVDYGTRFQPTRAQVSLPSRRALNTGNYSVIAESEAGGLARLLEQMEKRANALLNNDVQEKAPGTRGLTPTTVVVSPGEAILTVGALGDTDPQGDDVCAGPQVAGRCAGPILAGPNGRAETRANNRATRLALAGIVSSAFRNPQRNRAAGSASINSRHTLGSALDLDPRLLSIPGKTAPQLMCILEAAGDAVVGKKDAFTERGATTFLACDSPAADHVHVQR